MDEDKIDKIKFIAKIHVYVYRTSLQSQIDDYINSTGIKHQGEKSAWLFLLFFPAKFVNLLRDGQMDELMDK